MTINRNTPIKLLRKSLRKDEFCDVKYKFLANINIIF